MEGRVQLGKNTYIAPTSYVGGDVVIGDECTIMHHVTIRGDVGKITLGRRVNIQDGSILHTNTGDDLILEDGVSVGHRAVVHCLSVGRGTLVGIGAIILDGCEIGEECLIAAGAVVPPYTVVKPRTVMMGIPAKPVRSVNEKELAYMGFVVDNYLRLGRLHASDAFPNAVTPARAPT